MHVKRKTPRSDKKRAGAHVSHAKVLDKAVTLHAQAIASDPKKAKQFLVDAGIVTKSGALTANYR